MKVNWISIPLILMLAVNLSAKLRLFYSNTANKKIFIFQKAVKEELNCIPWYLPQLPGTSNTPCDPWQTKEFLEAIEGVN